ncbi:helix-turn-helix domain-containing protein [Lactococcus lactis]|uniref:Helix-turn-helix domain-containing protein n=1 Tax=Lactococcus lactis TaxID=1358 RepID=A0AAP3Z0Z5_9LACT|nr:helix-turn-helix transcriptional regulator [Lactococcus lactis]MDG4968278.1 helix-turn-helix domain-containing protein [Lactococcus lactis]MDG4976362.1 helix-turn-helix domain-containing protein [Lactococcus lactis]MDG5102166.1 helix-turn-helix domain-containing protein [Lactococcus lactis]
MDLYEKIKELAAQKNISIRQLEEKLGFANATLRRWNKNKPSVDKIQAVAKYFNVSVDYLLGIEDDKKPRFSPELNDAIENAEAYEGTPLTDQDKAILRGVIAAYLENRDKNKG